MCDRKGKKSTRKGTLLLIFAIVLLVAGVTAILAPILTMDVELHEDTKEYEQLKDRSRIAAPAESITEELESEIPISADMQEDAAFAPSPMTAGTTGVDLAACKAENPDFIAWLQVPGTTIDYPVVSTNDTQYYLEHLFSGKKSYLGTLLSLGKTDYRTPGKNIAIYGHHIRSNPDVMFSPLLLYKKQSFYADHKTIYLDSLYHSDQFVIFAVVNMRSGDWDPSSASFANDEDFLDFVNRARSKALYDTEVDVTANDQILTLITCDRSFYPTYGRLVVMAVRQQSTDQ